MRSDAFAGLTVGLMLVPQCIAYAALAGMPLESGLYSSMLPLVVATLLASSPRLGVGPSALSALMISAALGPLAQSGSASWVELGIWLALLSGGMQLLLGLLQMDWLMRVVTLPVLTGFTQAGAVLIIASQVPSLTGVPWHEMWQVSSQGGIFGLLHAIDWRALLFGMGGIAMLIFTRRLGGTIPWAALMLAAGALLGALIGYGASGSAVVGKLDVTLHGLRMPIWPGFGVLSELFLPALVLALISFVEASSSAKIEHSQAGTRWRPEQDMIAQGAAKIGSGLVGGFPTSASLSRSAVNRYAGAQTGWSCLIAAAVVLAATLWLTPLLAYVPMALLAALVVVSVTGMISPIAIRQFWQFSRVEACIALLTMVVTLLTAPRLYWGVLAGLLANLAWSMHQRLHPRIIEVGLFPEDGRLRDRAQWNLPALCEEVLAVRLDAGLDFATASALERRLLVRWDANPAIHSICLVASSINNIDTTGLETLFHLRNMARKRGGKLYLSGMKLPLEHRLARSGLFSDHHCVQVFKTDAETVSSLTHPDFDTLRKAPKHSEVAC